jgi:transposase
MATPPRFRLLTERLGPLPLLNHFLGRLGLDSLLDRFVPTDDRRCKLPYAKALGVLVRSILVEREPIYRQQETVQHFTPSGFGLTEEEVSSLRDDTIGRSLDHLFCADRASLLTAVVVEAVRRFRIRMDELHNDSSTIRFTGQYAQARGRRIRGRRAPWITYGHSKDHRPDLKQLLFILTTTADGVVPVHVRCEDGNTNDATTHLGSWEALREVTGRVDFLYVADCKLCAAINLHTIDRNGGRFVTVLPRTRLEDREFREWIQTHEPAWETVWNRPHPRRLRGPRDIWRVYLYHLPSREGWSVVWVYSSLLALHQEHSRRERLKRASQELDRLQHKLCGPRPRLRAKLQVEVRIEQILQRLRVSRYVHTRVVEEQEHRFRQEHPGRPTSQTRYRRLTRRRLRVLYGIDKGAIAYDEKSDGMYPLVSNDRELTARQALEAHKRQPSLEKRFSQLKSVHEIAPVFLKNEGRIEALFFVYFLGLLMQALIERELRRAMKRERIQSLPLYPEERRCRQPSTEQVLRLFSSCERHVLLDGQRVVQVFEPKLSDLQRTVLELLDVPLAAYRRG